MPDRPQLFGVSLPDWLTASVVVPGILQMLAFSFQNLLQEHFTASALLEGVRISWVFTLSEMAVCTAVPIAELACSSDKAATLLLEPVVVLRYMGLGAVLWVSTGLANEALAWVSISTLVVVKSAKLLPVMWVGGWWFGRTYTPRQWRAAALLVPGVVLCVVAARSEATIRFHLWGIVLLIVALMGDACYPHLQERMLNDEALGTALRQQEMLVGTNAFGFLFALATGVAGGELRGAATLLSERPEFAAAVVLHGLLQYVGLFFYLLLIAEHSARVAVTWASVRKAVTVLITFALAGRMPSALYIVGATAVLAAGCLERWDWTSR